MKHKAKCNAWMRKYLKVMRRNVMAGFEMGYDDGAAGKERQAPPFPETTRPGTLVYGVTVLAQEAYNRGYTFGRREQVEFS